MIAYIVHRFPVSTQTFTYDEVVAFGEAGLQTTVYSFRAGETLDWSVGDLRVRTLPPPVSAASVRALVWWAVRAPRRLLRAACWALAGPFVERPSFRERAAGALSLPRGALLAREADVALFHAQFANETATTALIAAHLSLRPFSFRSHTAPNPQLLHEKLRRARVVLSISEFDRSELLAAEPAARVVAAPLGIPMPVVSPGPREPGLVTSVGSLIEKKGHEVLIEACAKLVAEGIELRCEIIGDGHLREQLGRLTRARSLDSVVQFRGSLSRAEVLGRVGSAALFVLASVPSSVGVDGVPIALIEAMAVGTPCVSTRLSGIPELITDNVTGLLVEPNDVDGLAAAMRELLMDEALRVRLGSAAADLVRRERDAGVAYGHAAGVLSRAAGASSSS